MNQVIRVALVDGHSGTREGLIHLLGQMSGISVVGAARDEGEALEVVDSRRPDVVIIDHRRISANGAAFLHRLAAIDPHLGIVVLTAYLAEGEQTNLIRAGAQVILFKEIGFTVLVKTIRSVAAHGVSRRTEQEAGRGMMAESKQTGSMQSLSSPLREAEA